MPLPFFASGNQVIKQVITGEFFLCKQKDAFLGEQVNFDLQ